MLEVNRSVVHTPLTVNGVVYERGLGAHSISRLLYDLDGKAVSISGLAGADDKNLFAGKLQFKILGDKKELWKSGVMQKGDPVKEFNVNLKGVDKVLLLVEECGDGIMYDHADLAQCEDNDSWRCETCSCVGKTGGKGEVYPYASCSRKSGHQQSAGLWRTSG